MQNLSCAILNGAPHCPFVRISIKDFSNTECGFYGFSLGFFLMHLLVGTGFQPVVGE